MLKIATDIENGETAGKKNRDEKREDKLAKQWKADEWRTL